LDQRWLEPGPLQVKVLPENLEFDAQLAETIKKHFGVEQ